MNTFYRMSFAFVLLSGLLGGQAVSAATYYVATTGNDTQTCTTAQNIMTPKRTIASGVACLNPGDTLYIRRGTWTEAIDTLAHNGSTGKYITIAAYPGETVTLQPPGTPSCKYAIVPRTMNYIIIDGFVWDGVNSCNLYYGMRIVDGTHDFIMRNMEFKNLRSNGIYISNASNITIQNNRIHDQVSVSEATGERWYGIYYHDGVNGLIEGNEIYNNPGGGIQAYPGPITHLVVRRNSVHDNNFLTTSRVGGLIAYQGTGTPITGLQIYNNLFYKNGSSGKAGYAPGIHLDNGVSDAKIWHNTVYGNAGWGIQISTAASVNTVAQNNIAYSNTYGEIFNGGTGTTLDHNQTTNPRFMNAAALDFSLQPSSPATDAGVTLSEIKTDFRNAPRPQGGAYDIGAYEGGGGGSDTTPPNPPQSVAVK